MTYRGHVKDGQILLDEAISLPDGTPVDVALVEGNEAEDDLKTLLLRHAGKGLDLPVDLAAEHDRYAHGKRKS